MDIVSKLNCKELEHRILETMRVSGFNTSRIKTKPNQFCEDDSYIFDGLCRAVLSRRAVWDNVEKALPAIKEVLSDYDIYHVAALSDKEIDTRYEEKLKGKANVYLLRRKLKECRKNAEVFQDIRHQYGSVWKFIRKNLNEREYDESKKCYIQPNDETLMKCFIDPGSSFKLSGVRLAICCEFLKNIGIDEFKPDVHAIRFFNRIDLAENDGQEEIREIGIKIAEKLGKPRRYVDSLIWNFCAKGRGEICTADNPKCHLCELRIKVPLFCPDLDGFLKAIIKGSSYKITDSMKRHGFTRDEAHDELGKAGLKPAEIEDTLKKVYDSELDLEG